MRPRFRSLLKRSFSLPSAMRFSSPVSAFSILATKRADGLLFLLPSQRTTQDVSLLPARHLLDLHTRANLLEIIFQQLLLKLLELAACRAHQIPSATLADGHQVLFTHHPAIEDPYPPGFPMLALHRAQDRFDRSDIGPVPIEYFIAEWKTIWVHDQRQ